MIPYSLPPLIEIAKHEATESDANALKIKYFIQRKRKAIFDLYKIDPLLWNYYNLLQDSISSKHKGFIHIKDMTNFHYVDEIYFDNKIVGKCFHKNKEEKNLSILNLTVQHDGILSLVSNIAYNKEIKSYKEFPHNKKDTMEFKELVSSYTIKKRVNVVTNKEYYIHIISGRHNDRYFQIVTKYDF